MDSSSDHSGEKHRKEEAELSSTHSPVEKHVRFDAARTKKMLWKIDLRVCTNRRSTERR